VAARTSRTTGSRRARRADVETALVTILEEEVTTGPDAPRAGRGRRFTRVVRITGGWVIFGVGVVFVILPVIPGTPLVVLAAFMLAPDVPFFARVLDWSKARFSHVTNGLIDVNTRFTDDFHRRFKA
jgi:hypothetical protein